MEAATRRNFISGGAAVAVPLVGSSSSSAVPAPGSGLLAGKNAVVYGASGAMGGAVSHAFAREGATVFLAGRNFDHVDAVAREITASGGRAYPAGVDALDRASVEKHLGEVVRQHGSVDISFNLIGLGGRQGDPLTSMNVDSFSEAISTAMRTHYLTATAAARYMTLHKAA